MKFTWEKEDIKGGRRLRRVKSEPFMVGFTVSENSDAKYVLIDLRDGAVMRSQTKAQMAENLNGQGFWPESVEETNA